MTVNINATATARPLPHDAEHKRTFARELIAGLGRIKRASWKRAEGFARAQLRDAGISGRSCLRELSR